MAVVGVHALGANGQVLSGRLLRLSLGAVWLPGTGVQGVSGVLAGPANTQGELSIAGTTLTVQPFRAVIQNALDAAGGQYLVPNDAPVAFGGLAQDATQYRRSLVVVRVDDSQSAGVASSPTTDRGVLEVLPGTLAASAGASVLPTPTGSWLALGEVIAPPTGQAITVTPYLPRTMPRGAVLPVLADASTITGHAGAPPAYDGAPRWHPTQGLQVGVGGAWGSAIAPTGRVWDGEYGAAAGVVLASGSNIAIPYANDVRAADPVRRESGNTVFTILEDGVYALGASVRFTAGGTINGERFVGIFATPGVSAAAGVGLLPGAVQIAAMGLASPAGIISTPQANHPGRAMAAGQQLQIQAFQSSGASLATSTANWSRLLITRLR